MKTPTNIKPWFQGAAVGAIAFAMGGFTWGGWVTGGWGRENSAIASHDAVVAALAPVCAKRFLMQSDADARTGDLVKSRTHERAAIIVKSGYATMHGSNAAESDVARACAEIIAPRAELNMPPDAAAHAWREVQCRTFLHLPLADAGPTVSRSTPSSS
jgi:hypothetical protein